MGVFVERNEETFLFGLADELGVPAGDLRHALRTSAATAISRATRDQVADFRIAGQGEQAEASVFELAVNGDVSGNDSVDIQLHRNQWGMYLVWDDRTGAPVPGLGVAVSGEGADDDVIVRMSVSGLLPDDEKIIINCQGNEVVELPLCAYHEGVIISFVNVSKTSKAAVSITGRALKSKSSLAAAAREQMRARGIPAGRAKSALFGSIAAAVQEGAAMAVAGAGEAAKAATSRSPQAMGRVLGRTREAVADRVRLVLSSPLKNAGVADLGEPATVGGVAAAAQAALPRNLSKTMNIRTRQNKQTIRIR